MKKLPDNFTLDKYGLHVRLVNEDDAAFISEALQPAEVTSVTTSFVTKENGHVEKRADVVVPDNQYSLAIGRSGQNVRLAARLTGFKIDIKTESAISEADSRAILDEFTVVEDPDQA